jgi:hypothetical protein
MKELRPAIKKLSLRRRHLGITALDRNNIKRMILAMISFGRMKKLIDERDEDDERREDVNERLMRLVTLTLERYKEIAYVDIASLRAPLPAIQRRYRTIESFADDEIPIYFRFRSKEQLHRLMNAFRNDELL